MMQPDLLRTLETLAREYPEVAALIKERDALVQRNEAFWQEIERLEAELKPFAAAWQFMTEDGRGMHPDHILHIGVNAADVWIDDEHRLFAAHLQAAFNALKAKQP